MDFGERMCPFQDVEGGNGQIMVQGSEHDALYRQ